MSRYMFNSQGQSGSSHKARAISKRTGEPQNPFLRTIHPPPSQSRPLNRCVILGKLLNLSKSHLVICKMGISSCGVVRFSELIRVRHLGQLVAHRKLPVNFSGRECWNDPFSFNQIVSPTHASRPKCLLLRRLLRFCQPWPLITALVT